MTEVRQLALTMAPLRGASPAMLDGLRADLAFCHPAIKGVAALDPERATLALLVDDGALGDGAELARQLEQVVAASIASYRFVPETASSRCCGSGSARCARRC